MQSSRTGGPERAYSGPERRRADPDPAAQELARGQLAALSQAAADMVSAESVEEVTRIAVRAAVSAVDADGGTLAVLDGDALQLVSTEQYNPELREAYPRLPLDAALPVSHAARTGERLLLRTRREAADRFPQVVEHQRLTDVTGVPIVSAAVLPLSAGRRLLGSLTVTWSVERGFSAGDVELLEAIAELVAGAVDRVRRSGERDRALARAGLLARSAYLLTAGLDQQAVCQALVDLVVPGLGQEAVVELAGTSPGSERVVRRGSAPGDRSAAGLLARQPDPADAGRAGRRARASRCVVPLLAGGRRLGSLTVGRSDEPYLPQERNLLRAVADRAALALDTAVLFAEHRETSLALQHALLTEPPEPDHLEVVVRYQPASRAAVGGDWYDAVLTPDGATVLVIGDVVGHDARAAASMGQTRGLLRAVAYTSGDTPAGVLTRTEQAARGLSVTALATAVVARIERAPGGGRLLRWSNAGHPAPALVRADGSVRLLEAAPDLMLGVDEQTRRADHRVDLADGDTLLLYTDGLVERRDETLDVGLGRLLSHLAELAAVPPDVLCDALLARLLRDGAEDDVALLAVRLHPEDRPRPRSAGPGSAGPWSAGPRSSGPRTPG